MVDSSEGRGSVRAVGASGDPLCAQAQLDIVHDHDDFVAVGGGAVFSLQVAARYLTWWHQVGWSPEQGRAFLWGADVGNQGQRGVDAMQLLYDAIGDVALLPLSSDQLSYQGDNLTMLGFAMPDSDKKVVVAFPADQKKAATLSDWSFQVNAAGNVATAHLITGQGIQDMPVSWHPDSGLAQPLSLPDMSLAIWITE